MADAAPALAGLVVVDLTQIYNGPYATFLLAQAGAEVIKIEPPGGEHLRRRTVVGGAALPYAMLNANKRPVTLNLKHPRGRELLLEMVRRADALAENFAPGVMDRLGLGWPVVHEINPRLVYASSSGYGSSGPYRDYPAMDLTMQAMSGVMSVTGFADGPPMRAGPALCDFMTGVHLYGAITTALFARERTGVGRHVEVAMQEAIYASLASNFGLHFGSKGSVPLRTGNRHGGLAESPYNVYQAADGYIAILCVGEVHWRTLAGVMGQPELADDPRFSTLGARVANMDAVDAIVSAWTRPRTKQELFEVLMANHVSAAPVRDLDEVVNDPHLHQRGFLNWIDHPEIGRVALPISPIRDDDAEPVAYAPSGRLGEQNAGVYGDWLGLDAAEIAKLAQDGVI